MTGETDFFSQIKSSRLKTFKQKSRKSCSGDLNASTKEDKHLLTRILLLGKDRDIDVKETLTHSLFSLPLCFSPISGSMDKTSKSALIHFLEKNVLEMHVEESPTGCAVIFDGMAEIQRIADHVPATFGELALTVCCAV